MNRFKNLDWNKLDRIRIEQKKQPVDQLVLIGEQKVQVCKVTCCVYDKDSFEEYEMDVEKFLAGQISLIIPPKGKTLWIDVVGLHNIQLIEKLGNIFNIHPTVLEDILDTTHRPKADRFDDFVFITLKNLLYNEPQKKIDVEQMSILFGDSFVITFQERDPNEFEPVRNQLRAAKCRARKFGPDFLTYLLIDIIFENYLPVLESLGDQLDNLDEKLDNPSKDLPSQIHHTKQDLYNFRKLVIPLRESFSRLEKEENDIISKNTRPFFRDLYDQMIHITETMENYRDNMTNILSTYQSTIGNKMNLVMSVLTIISTIFMPLTLIAGIYGMNFHHMPELEWIFGYPFAILLMIIVASGMLFVFKKRGWFSRF